MTDKMQRARERISDMVLEVLACEPCIGTCESEESFAHRIAVAAALRSAQVPEGWVLVPLDAVTAAATELTFADCEGAAADLLNAMLAAAPKPEDS